MMKQILLILGVLFFASCKDQNKKAIQQSKKPAIHMVKKHQITTPLSGSAIDSTNTWKEYIDLAEDLKKFYSISAGEALNNALQLSSLTKLMKDSIRPKHLINDSFRTRVNVLETEVLRLKDMTYISAITAKEVNLQVAKIMSAFAATNSKINTVYTQLEVEKEILTNTKENNIN